MEFTVNIPLFSIVLCLMCAVISSLMSGKTARKLSITLCGAVALGAAILLVYGIQSKTETEYTMGHFPHPWGNELRFGILEPLLVALFGTIIFLCLLGGARQLEVDLDPIKSNLYYIMCDLSLAALQSLAYTNDVFTGYVFIEICTISACGLLMIRQIGRTTLASIRYMIFSLIGSGLFLIGVILLYSVTGHLLMPNLKESIGSLYRSGKYHITLIAGMTLITLGLAIKSGLFPFHFWMPDTYGYATPSSGGILSGIISKGYIFFLLKMIFEVFGTDVFYASGIANILYVFGIGGVIIGSVSATREKEVFRMVAYSSAAQIGYIYMGIGLSPSIGCVAAVFHILTHAVTKPMLFLASAQISDDACGQRNEDGHLRRNWQGMGFISPVAGLAFTIGAFSMIGIPLTMGFVSKYQFALAAFQRSNLMVLTMVVLAVSTVLNGIYFGRVVVQLYTLGNTHATRFKSTRYVPFVAAMVLFLAFNITGGVAAATILRLLEAGLGLL